MIAKDVPDLNHLMAEGRWDKYLGEWVVDDPLPIEDVGMAETWEDERFPQSEEEYDGTV
jgi:hypothetical protein